MAFHSRVTAGGHDELLTRLRLAQTPLVALIAPPGYGKHQLASAYAAQFDIAAEIVAARDFDEERLLGAVRDSLGTLERWTCASSSACVVILHAERMREDALRAGLERLLAVRGVSARLVVCSEREPSYAFMEMIEPHLTVTLRAQDLEFRVPALRLLAASGPPVDDVTLLRIEECSGGWPIAVHYLLALAQRAAFEAEAADLGALTWRELFDWLELRLREMLDEELWEALTEAVVRMEARPADLRGSSALRLVRELQLAEIGIVGEVRVAPLVRAYMHARRRRELIEKAYQILATSGESDPIRTARALINVGELRRAETLLEPLGGGACLEVGDYPYPGMLLETMSRIKLPYHVYPRVWLALAVARSFTESAVTLGEEGASILAIGRLEPGIEAFIRCATGISFARGGRPSVALQFAEELAVMNSPAAGVLREVLLLLVDAQGGNYRRAIERWQAHGQSLAEFSSLYAFALRWIVRVTFASGAIGRALELVQLMASLTRVGGSPLVYMASVMESAMLAWISGDDSRFLRSRSELAQSFGRYEVPLYRRGTAAMFDLWLSGSSIGDTQVDAVAALMIATQSQDAASAIPIAIAEADRSRQPWLRTVARLVAAIRDPRGAGAYIAEAKEAVAGVESPALREAVERFVQGSIEIAMFRGALERAKRASALPASRPAQDGVFVDVAAGEVLVNGKPAKVSDGVMQLLVALAVRRGTARRDALIDMLWPDLDALSAASALKMRVHRARHQLGDPSVLLVERGRYALGPHVTTNYDEILDSAARVYPEMLSQQARTTLELLLHPFWNMEDAMWAQWTWFMPYGRALGDAAQTLAHVLTRDALVREEYDRALRIARSMSATRPLDERPRVLIVQALLAAGKRSEALQEYMEYQTRLRRELDLEPSPELKALLA